MLEEASEQADIRKRECDAEIRSLTKQIDELEKHVHNGADPTDQVVLAKKTTKLKSKLDASEAHFKKAQATHKWAHAKLTEATDVLNDNADIFRKAKLSAEHLEHRANADQTMRENTINAYGRFKSLENDASIAKHQAGKLRAIAAEKASAEREAQDYKERQTLVKDVLPSLGDMTLISSTKFRYFEDSLALPFNQLHSISEGKMMQLLASDSDLQCHNFREFNKNHLTRIYPSRQDELRTQSNNFNPVLPWSLGCQIASTNQQVCDALVLVNDGRFRANGCCGYVLKPGHMIEHKGDIVGRYVKSAVKLPHKWRFKVLSAYNLPKSRKKNVVGHINPRVRVTLYDGGLTSPIVHLTDIVEKDGFNPVWNEDEGVAFDDIKDPSSAGCAVLGLGF